MLCCWQALLDYFADEEAKLAAGKSGILLLDDIITTGSTLNECARLLKKAVTVRV